MSAVSERALRVGLVHNWPGARNSEFDLIQRIGGVLRRLGHTAIAIDPVGVALDEQGDRIGTAAQAREFDLTLNLHYLNPKYLMGLSYVVNWNPIDYLVKDPITRLPLPIKQVGFIVDCLRTHDRVLSAGSHAVDEYARLARTGLQMPPWISGAELYLHTTIESQGANEGRVHDVGDFKVFYIGINWEKMSADPEKRVRHAGLFEALDRSAKFEFYGLKEQAGVPLWDGIASYRGELAFNGGQSIVEKCRDCGAALVLSSDQHRSSAVVSTRIFQAAAAGAVIITDRNPFIEEHFGDSVLYFDYADSDVETAQNILRCVAWIETNWIDACRKAEDARRIFEQWFALEREISLLCEQAKTDLAARRNWAEACSSRHIRVVYRPADYRPQEFATFLENVGRQIHCSLGVTISAPRNALRHFEDACAATATAIAVEFRAAEEDQTLGSLLARVVGGEGDFVVVYSDGFVWREDHLLCLLAAIEGDDAEVAYSPLFREDSELKVGLDMMAFFIHGMDGGFRRVTESVITRFEMSGLPLGNFLWRSSSAYRLERDHGFLSQFDVASVYALTFASYVETRSLPAAVCGITSRYMQSAADWAYDEYNSNRLMGRFAREQDRNAFHAFFRYFAGASAIVDFDEILASWEYEQLEGGFVPTAPPIASRAELLREVGRMRARGSFWRRVNNAGALANFWSRLGDRLKGVLRRTPSLHRLAILARQSFRNK